MKKDFKESCIEALKVLQQVNDKTTAKAHADEIISRFIVSMGHEDLAKEYQAIVGKE